MEIKMARLVYDNPFPPFAFEEKGKARGVCIEILSEILIRAHLQATFIPAPMQQIQSLLHSREADGIVFYAVTPERQLLFDFSDPIIVTGAALFSKSPGPPIPGLRECKNKSIVTPNTGPLREYIRKESPKAKLLLVQDYLEALKAVLEGKADIAALNIHVGRYLIDHLFNGLFALPEKVFLEVPLTVAVLKGNDPSLLSRINEGLSRLRVEGTYQRIVEKWLPATAASRL